MDELGVCVVELEVCVVQLGVWDRDCLELNLKCRTTYLLCMISAHLNGNPSFSCSNLEFIARIWTTYSLGFISYQTKESIIIIPGIRCLE